MPSGIFARAVRAAGSAHCTERRERAVPVDSMDGMDDMDMGHGCMRAESCAPSTMSIGSTRVHHAGLTVSAPRHVPRCSTFAGPRRARRGG